MAIVDLSDNIQDGILFFLLTDLKFIKICKNKLDPKIFQSTIQQRICSICFDFYDRYESTINDNIDIILSSFHENEQSNVFQYLEKITSGKYQIQYVLDKLNLFVSKRMWEQTLVGCVEHLDNNDIEAIEKKVFTLIKDKLGSLTSIKDFLTENFEDFYKQKERGSICSPSGIKALDEIIGGFKYKELSMIVAPLNVGKSWAFVYFGSKALLYGKNVLHLTLEMSGHQVKERYLMRFAGVSEKPLQNIDVWDNTGKRTNIEPDSLSNIKKVKEARDVMKNFGGHLYISEWPDKTLTISKLEDLINEMELETGKFPDMIIVDGLQGLKYSNSKDDWKNLGELTHELRRIAMEKNIAVLASTHSDRGSIGNKLVQSHNVRGSIDILNIADLGISINQTNEEFACNQARLFIMRARTSKKWVTIRIYQNFDIGHFATYSELVE